MKQKTTITVVLFAAFLLLGCGQSKQKDKVKSEDITNNSIDNSREISNEEIGNEIDYDNTKVIKTVFVSNKNGADFKQDPSSTSKPSGRYQYNKRLDVIEEVGEWYGVRDRISRTIIQNGKTIERIAWEKVYVMKQDTETHENISLSETDLNIISYQILNENYENFENYEDGKILDKIIKVELSDELEFEKWKTTSTNYLSKDSILKKQNGMIELKCDERSVKYIDDSSFSTNEAYYDYVGQFSFLNAYLIHGRYWENSDYILIDKVTGEEIQRFCEYPNISPDTLHIICVKPDPYSIGANIESYSISNQNIEQILNVYYKYWMSSFDTETTYWGNNNYLYIKAKHINSFWNPDGSYNENYQFIRIKIL